MVYTITSFEVVQGRMKEARDWNKRFYGYLKKAYGLDAHSMQAVDAPPGQANRILVITPYDSLSAWAAHIDKVAGDAQRNALMSEALEEKQYFVAHSATRTVYQTF